MISSDENVKNIVSFLEDSKRWVELRTEYTKVETVNKTSEVVGHLFLLLVMFIMAMLVLICVSFSIAYALAQTYCSIAMAFAIVSVFYVLLFILGFATRRIWLYKPLLKIFSADTPQGLDVRAAELRAEITKNEESLKNTWDNLTAEEKEQSLSPTKRILSIVMNSANVVDGALLGWKLYKLFKKR